MLNSIISIILLYNHKQCIGKKQEVLAWADAALSLLWVTPTVYTKLSESVRNAANVIASSCHTFILYIIMQTYNTVIILPHESILYPCLSDSLKKPPEISGGHIIVLFYTIVV